MLKQYYDLAPAERTDGCLREMAGLETQKYRLLLPVPLYADPERETREIQAMIACAVHSDEGQERVAISNEYRFGGDTAPALRFGEHAILLNGSIDRVDRAGDEFEVIDYKTGNPENFRKYLDDKLQWLLYARA